MIPSLTFVTPLSIDCPERARNWSKVFQTFKGVPAEWIVVESGSSEAKKYPVTRVELQAFTRPASRNAGIQHANTEHVCFIDADMLMRVPVFMAAWEKFINEGYDALSPYHRVVFSGRRNSRIACEKSEHVRWSFLLQQKNSRRANIAGGICIAKKKVMEDIGGYDERFKGWGFEDVALDNLLRKAEAKIGYHKAMSYHLWHPAKRTRSQKRLFLKVRKEKLADIVPCKQLEYHITDVCNLHCSQCAHYSNFPTKGMVSVEQASDELGPWAERVKPKSFYILGGEPTLNKDLIPLLELSRSIFPESRLELVTNGFFLHRHPELPQVLVDQEVSVRLSQHHSGEEYMEKFRGVLELVDKWRSEYPDLRMRVKKSQEIWQQRYHMEADGKAYPFKSRPTFAWSECVSRQCHTIYKGYLWKCPPITYFSNLEEKLQLHDIREWDRFRQYNPLGPDCTMQELKSFFNQGAIPACALCPEKPNEFILPNPLRLPVIEKK